MLLSAIYSSFVLHISCSHSLLLLLSLLARFSSCTVFAFAHRASLLSLPPSLLP